MSQMPEIKPVVNKEPERDKKKAGLFARLFGGGASGGGAGLGGFGGAGAGGGLASGGILATKAGVLALVLVGTTVAGGIGMVGYRLFGPGAEMTGNGDNLQLFASKPKETASADGQGAAKGDGNSASLQYLSQANTTPKEGDAAAAGATKDATAASATSADAAAAGAAGGANGPLNASGSSGNGVSHAMLKNTGKFGALSGPNSGGGGTSAVASAAPQKAPTFDPNAAAKGSLSGFKKPSAATIGGGTSRSLAGKHFGGAFGQGLGVLGNQRGAQSSYAAGQTYDGAASGGSNIGNNGTPIGGPGAGAGGGAQPKTMPAPSLDQNSSQNIPSPPGVPMAPWQSQIQKAQMLIGLAVALLFAAKLLGHTGIGLWATRIIGAVVGIIGIMVISLGAQIAHGKYGQKLQGGMLAAAGTGLVIAGIAAGMASSDADAAKQAAAPGGGAPAATSTTSALGSSSSSSTGMLAGIDPFVVLGGGMALAGLAGTMMMPPQKYPAQDSKDPDWPKPTSGFFGYQQYPSERALKKMIA